MQAIFIRHASAEPVGAAGDAARALTETGRAEARTTAAALRAMGVRLERVLTSPLARAMETAGIVSEVHDGAPVEPAEFLAPPVDGQALVERLMEFQGQEMGAVGLIGHTPSLERGIGRIVANDPCLAVSLSKAGAAAIVFPKPDTDQRPVLQWVMRREQLAVLAMGAGGA